MRYINTLLYLHVANDGNAIPADPLSDSDENCFFDRFLSLSVLFSEILTLSV